MTLVSSGHLVAAHGQGLKQVGELLLAFGFTALIGLERQLRGKAAGLRTQAIVGTTSALILLVSKYGFGDVLVTGKVTLDPSRVAAQIVSGIGFLGAGLILTRGGSVRGLTTAAAVWESAAIGMAAGAGLPLLAGVVTGLHFVTVLGFSWLASRLPGSRTDAARVRVSYRDGQGTLRGLLATGTTGTWTVTGVRFTEAEENIAAELDVVGGGSVDELLARLSEVPGVAHVEIVSDEEFD
ncbi:MgtC/SapB family protein [Cryptosporangium sp. NPDC051539]|uniref:MgtC/SapB family protein n=1 Tax=Cryptosporangium sp. NPDC051539 TaxID=3363962 RepID=UPI00379D1600